MNRAETKIMIIGRSHNTRGENKIINGCRHFLLA